MMPRSRTRSSATNAKKPSQNKPIAEITNHTAKNYSELLGASFAISMAMMLDREQTEVLREILQASLTQLRIESARTVSHDFREALHRRVRVVEGLLMQLGTDQ